MEDCSIVPYVMVVTWCRENSDSLFIIYSLQIIHQGKETRVLLK